MNLRHQLGETLAFDQRYSVIYLVDILYCDFDGMIAERTSRPWTLGEPFNIRVVEFFGGGTRRWWHWIEQDLSRP